MTTPQPISEEVILEGHIIDSFALPRTLDAIMDLGGNFTIMDMRVGRTKVDTSFARLCITADNGGQMAQIMQAISEFGAQIVGGQDVRTAPAPAEGALPEDFYSTTNLPTQVRLAGHWLDVAGTEMDLAVRIDASRQQAQNVPITEVRTGDAIVVGHEGVRVRPLARARDADISAQGAPEVFSFMGSAVSSERPNHLVIGNVAQSMRQTRESGAKIAFVVGPAVIHTGAGPYLARLIRAGYVQVLLGGNAIVTHDIESQLYGTSLGVDLNTGMPVPGGHSHHMRAINAMRRIGSLEKAVQSGVLKSGVIYETIQNQVRTVLAGSVRDDGPMPGVIADMMEAQRQMRAALDGVEMVVMLATMLHSIATGNLLPAATKVVVIDINPATVTKLADRGTFQALGIVTDAGLFLRELVEALDLPEG